MTTCQAGKPSQRTMDILGRKKKKRGKDDGGGKRDSHIVRRGLQRRQKNLEKGKVEIKKNMERGGKKGGQKKDL